MNAAAARTLNLNDAQRAAAGYGTGAGAQTRIDVSAGLRALW